MKLPIWLVWIVVLLGAVLVVVLIVGVGWLGFDPDVMVAGGTLALALATFCLTAVAFNEMQEGRKRAEESKRASLRPLLIPVGSLGPFPDEAAIWEPATPPSITIQN